MRSLLRRARYDGYTAMEGLVLAENVPMLALARKLGFSVEAVPPDGTVLRVLRRLGVASAPPVPPARHRPHPG
jgi:RimJ/RimL family protein N-acetyltransferase